MDNLILDGLPGHGCTAGGGERAGAADDHAAILIQHEPRVSAADTGQRELIVGDELTAGEGAGFAAYGVFAFIGETVGVEVVVLSVEEQVSGHPAAGSEVDLPVGGLIGRPAGVLHFGGVLGVAADGAFKSAGLAVIHVGVLVVLALGNDALVLIKHGSAAVGGHVIGGDGCFVLVSGEVHVDAGEVECCDLKVEVGVIDDGVRLTAGGTADIVHRTGLVYLTVGHGSGAGIAVVVAGEVEVDTGRVAGCGEVLVVGLTAAGGVGVVGGNVSYEDLPHAVGLRGVSNEPIGELLEAVLIGGVVQNRDVHVAALNGVPRGGDAEGGHGRDGAVAVVVSLVVADDVENIGILEPVLGEQGQGILPLVEVAYVIDRVAKLDAERVLVVQAGGDASHTLKRGLLLDVGQQEEAAAARSGEAADIRPLLAVADAIVVGRSGGQAGQGDAVHTGDLVAGGVGDKGAGAVDGHSVLQLRVSGYLGNGLFGAGAGIAHPGDVLAAVALGEVEVDVEGETALIAHGVVAEQGDHEGAVAVLVVGTQIHAALSFGQAGDVDLTLFVGDAEQLVVRVDIDADCGLVVLDDGDGRGGGAADDGVVRLDAVHGLNGVIAYLSGEAGGVLVQIGDVEVCGLLAAVGALGDLNVDAAALGGGGGNLHDDGGELVGLEAFADAGDLHRHDALRGVIAPGAGDAVGEGDVLDGVAAGYGDVRGQGGDAGDAVADKVKLPCLAHDRRALRFKRDVGQICFRGLYGEVARLARDVAVAVFKVECYGVQTVAEVHQTGGAAEDVLVVNSAVGAVKVEVRGLNAGGVGIGILTVVIRNEEAKLVGIQSHAVLKINLGAIVVNELDGVDDGGGDVLIVCTVDDAEVIEKNPALQVALIELDAVGVEPADTAGSDHGAEEHTAVDTNKRACIRGQVSLKILPAILQAFTGIGAAGAKVDIGVRPALTTVGAGGDLCAQPGNGYTFGEVDPDADRGGSTINGEITAKTEAGTVGTGQACPVVVELNGLVAKADDIGKLFIGIGHNGACDNAAAARVVIGRHSVGGHAVEALNRCSDGGVVPAVSVAAVKYHGRLHAYVDGNGRRKFTERGGDGGAAGIFHVVGNGKQIAGEAAGVRIGNAPLNVVILKIDGLRLIGCLEAKIADVFVIQVDLIGGKGQLVGVLDMQHGGTDCSAAAYQIDRHFAGLAGGGEGRGGGAAADGGFAYRAHALIADREADALRQACRRRAGEIHGAGRQGNGGVGGVVLFVGSDRRMVKLTGCRNGGDDQNSTGDDTLAAAGRSVAHGQIALTLTLGNVGGGAALVELDSCDAAERDHHVRLFARGVADGTGSHGAVCLEEDDGAVSFHANAGAGVIAAVAGLVDDDLAVPYHGDQRVDRLEDLNGLALLFALAGLSLGERGAFLEYVHGAVVKRCDEGAAGVVMVDNSVHHQVAARLAGVDVEPGGVDAAHNVQAALFFIGVSLIGSGLEHPALLFGVAVAVSGHDLGTAAGGVDLHDVCNRLGVARIIVRDYDTLRDVGCDGVVFHRGNMVAGAGNGTALDHLSGLSLYSRGIVIGHCGDR